MAQQDLRARRCHVSFETSFTIAEPILEDTS